MRTLVSGRGTVYSRGALPRCTPYVTCPSFLARAPHCDNNRRIESASRADLHCRRATSRAGRTSRACATCRRSSGSRASRPGWAGCSTAWTCTCTCWWPTPFVAELLGATDQKDPQVGYYSSWIQAAFLIGWALGGGFFGRIGDRLGRSRALMLTILTYALFTGLSFFAQTWWHLLIFRFLAALGIGGEWAVGASLLSETWPRRWRPWMAAVLQTGVNLGVMLAGLAIFLLAGLPAAHGVPGRRAAGAVGALDSPRRARAGGMARGQQRTRRMSQPAFCDLFRGPVRRTTLLTLLVCGLSLTAHWAFMFWYLQHLRNLPELATWTDVGSRATGQQGRVAGDGDRRSSATSWRPALARWLRLSPRDRLAVPGVFRVDAGDLRRAARPRRTVVRPGGDRLVPGACSRCSRCTCRRCFPRCCGPPGRASATTSAASPRAWARCSSGCSRRSAIRGWPSCSPASCFSPPPALPG